jgi:hypothetical protein
MASTLKYSIQPLDLLAKKADRVRFINLAWKIYQDDSVWVPPFKMSLEGLFNKKHPFYTKAQVQAYILMDDNGQDCGRILAIHNRAHNEFHQEEVGFFGFFECINDPIAADILFQACREWLRSQGLQKMRGPVNPSTNYECGLLVDGFHDSPQIMMTYNPTYYAELFSSVGLSQVKDLYAYTMPTTVVMPEVVQKISKRSETSHKITYRPIDKKRWDQEIDNLIDIYNDAWEKNWGFIPMTDAEFHHTAKDLKSVADPRFILIAEVDKKPAAFLVCLPDYNQVFKQIPNGSLFPTGLFKLLTPKKRINRVRVITLGVKKEYRKIGLEALLYIKIQEEVLKAQGYVESEMSWILEDNLNMTKPLVRMGAKPYKTYRLFEQVIPS